MVCKQRSEFLFVAEELELALAEFDLVPAYAIAAVSAAQAEKT
jgi:hypothetical protein